MEIQTKTATIGRGEKKIVKIIREYWKRIRRVKETKLNKEKDV